MQHRGSASAYVSTQLTGRGSSRRCMAVCRRRRKRWQRGSLPPRTHRTRPYAEEEGRRRGRRGRVGCDNGSILDECQFRLLSETVSTPFASFVRREEMNEGVPCLCERTKLPPWCGVRVPFSSVPTWFVVTRPGHARPLIFILGTRTRNALCLPACIWQLAPTKTARKQKNAFSNTACGVRCQL